MLPAGSTIRKWSASQNSALHIQSSTAQWDLSPACLSATENCKSAAAAMGVHANTNESGK